MTENEMLEIAIHCLGVQAEQEVCEECPVYLESGIACREAARTAITALKELQYYRIIKDATIREIAETLGEYAKIGTVEECQEAAEKQKPKKCDVKKDNFRIFYNCPTCNHNLRIEYNRESWRGKKSKCCSYCGQVIQWDNENLEGME